MKKVICFFSVFIELKCWVLTLNGVHWEETGNFWTCWCPWKNPFGPSVKRFWLSFETFKEPTRVSWCHLCKGLCCLILQWSVWKEPQMHFWQRIWRPKLLPLFRFWFLKTMLRTSQIWTSKVQQDLAADVNIQTPNPLPDLDVPLYFYKITCLTVTVFLVLSFNGNIFYSSQTFGLG